MHKRHSSDTGALEKRKAAAGWVSDDVISFKDVWMGGEKKATGLEPVAAGVICKTSSVGAHLHESDPPPLCPRVKDKKKRMELKFGYQDSKKRASMEVRQVFINGNTTIKSGWLRVRNSFRKWIKLYCVIKPGLLILFRSSHVLKPYNWAGTVLLNSCQIIERPSKKMGFCFNLYHPLGSNFWAKKGPRGEVIFSLKSVGLPASSLIVRAAEDDESGRDWVESIKVAKTADQFSWNKSGSGISGVDDVNGTSPISPLVVNGSQDMVSRDSASSGKHLVPRVVVDCDSHSSSSLRAECSCSESSSSASSADETRSLHDDNVEADDQVDLFADNFDDNLESSGLSSGLLFTTENSTEESSDIENRRRKKTVFVQTQYTREKEGDSELEATVKMKDSLNATSLPAKPSSFNDCKFQSSLQLLSKCFERSSILEMAHRETKPLNRMIAVLKFILSGFCTIQPESASTDEDPSTVLKPILGEVYRCYWDNKGTKAFFVTQFLRNDDVSQACCYVTNRRLGFTVCGSILQDNINTNTIASAASNHSISRKCSWMEIAFLERSEVYSVDLSGFAMSNFSKMDRSAKVFRIVCAKTGYSVSLSMAPAYDRNSLHKARDNSKKSIELKIDGKVRLGNTVLAQLHGDLGSDIYISEVKQIVPEEAKVLWAQCDLFPNENIATYVPKCSEWLPNESAKIVQHIANCSTDNDSDHARLKTKLESYRNSFASSCNFLFELSALNGSQYQYEYKYKYRDYRPWDISNDVTVYEKHGGCITTHRKVPLRSLTEFSEDMTSSSHQPNEISANQSQLVHHQSSMANHITVRNARSALGPSFAVSNVADVRELQSSIAGLTREIRSVSDVFRGSEKSRSHRIHFMLVSTIIYTLLSFITLALAYFSYHLL